MHGSALGGFTGGKEEKGLLGDQVAGVIISALLLTDQEPTT